MGKHVVLAGGGTAGHVNPLLAVAQQLRDEGWDVRVLGTEQGLESDLVPGAGFPFTVVPKAPLPRRPSAEIFTLPARLREAERVATEAIRRADVVVGFGGYVSVPAYRAAAKLGVPVVLHEQNARPGLANRYGARSAAAVALTFSDTQLAAKRGVTRVTGLPLRSSIASLVEKRGTEQGKAEARRSAAERLGVDPDASTLLITGGSLGAQSLNQAVVEASADLPAGAQVIHLTGRSKDGPVREGLSRNVQDRWVVLDYLNTMEDALAVSDLVLCRSGAGTVAELSALGLPAFYVPLPIGNGEQRLNARGAVESGGALLVADSDFTAQTVKEEVFPLLEDRNALEDMSARALVSSVGDGTGPVVELVREAAK